ncbi:glycosyltransferase [Heterostelium album PN500]|uniref:Dol-P-Glc:Glc(2)Man(9)GlcNAc(2)-PP-Dol alpha-1,2-glucosyltransferase n=1 Tax=Heterostelium pallidum (strain ATCC 26659 / Pp 5 / PN500) TaxID=670386 RepID=D3BAI0_HETP5|nr:glycosyltransferase [Heterostelium album PN500]EFA81567.1 glycosyltransferase [Heterostelium album PN500]|eukprot:XP_020433684.1 glycosyltransferase [Heterostelium album PN500]
MDKFKCIINSLVIRHCIFKYVREINRLFIDDREFPKTRYYNYYSLSDNPIQLVYYNYIDRYINELDLCLKESTINNLQKSQQTSKQSEKSPPTNLSREFKLLSYTYCLADAFRRARYNGSDEQCTLIRSRYSEFIDCSVYDERFETKVLEDACKSDQLEIVEKVGNGQLSGHITDKVLQLAIQSGSLSTVKYIVETQPHDLFDIGRAMNLAVTTNRTKIFVSISESKIPKVSEYYLFDQTMINKAIENGNLMVVRNIFDQMSLSSKTSISIQISLFVASIYLFNQFKLNVPENYVDEIFHVPQTQRYCNLEFNHWDDKITTLPGLYVFSAFIAHILRVVAPSLPFCSTDSLRLVNLFYTDVLSTLSVLLVYYLSLKKRYTLSSLVGLFSVFSRQTNIVWIFFIALVSIEDIYKNKQRPRQVVPSLVGEIFNFIKFALSNLLLIVRLLYGYIFVGLAFVAFLKVNGGIVVGDKSNHESAFHFVQLLYFSLYCYLFNAPSATLSVFSPIHFAKSLLSRPIKSIPLITIISLFLYKMIDLFTHYSFYLWNKIFLKYPLSKFALIPLYIYSVWMIWKSLKAGGKSNLWLPVYW